MKKLLQYIWQLPQNVLGWLLCVFFKGTNSIYASAIIRRSSGMRGGIALGKYIIVSEHSDLLTIRHEYGHCRQSKRLGWLYLFVIGIPSIIYAAWWVKFDKGRHDYYDFYTERWADKLGGIKR